MAAGDPRAGDPRAGDPRGEYDADDGRAANKRGSVISVRTKLH